MELHSITPHIIIVQVIYARTLCDYMAGGGFVLGASNAVQREVPAENYRAMLAAWKRYGTYPPP